MQYDFTNHVAKLSWESERTGTVLEEPTGHGQIFTEKPILTGNSSSLEESNLIYMKNMNKCNNVLHPLMHKFLQSTHSLPTHYVPGTTCR